MSQPQGNPKRKLFQVYSYNKKKSDIKKITKKKTGNDSSPKNQKNNKNCLASKNPTNGNFGKVDNLKGDSLLQKQIHENYPKELFQEDNDIKTSKELNVKNESQFINDGTRNKIYPILSNNNNHIIYCKSNYIYNNI